MACSGPGESMLRSGPGGPRRSREGATLAHVEADARHWHEVFQSEKSSPSPVGSHALLIEPMRSEVLDALCGVSEAVETFAAEDDWGGGQVDFAFAGHGTPDGQLVVRDGVISAREILDAVLAPSRANGEKRRLSLVLDSCYSGRTLAEVVVDERQASDFLLIDGFAACMHDEVAWELDLLGHGALSFAMGARTDARKGPDASTHDQTSLARAVRERNDAATRAALCRHTPNPVTYLTDGDQCAVEVINGWHIGPQGGGSIELLGHLSVPSVLNALERARSADDGAAVPL